MNLSLMAHVDFDAKKALRRLDVQTGGRVQQVIDKSVIDWCLKYCPWDAGVLAKSAYSATVIGSGLVVYPGPYAHYQYVGEVYGPNIPRKDDNGNIIGWYSPPGKKKHPTGRKMAKYSQSGTGPEWFSKAKERHGDKWLRLVREEVGKG